ncbi:MBL fold metallo-hydrolase [Paenibacillus aceris]|uniref:Glyoxylase-like metal-dependent hydrolase (Beta-lactamase superfamily II) n=1 Tax=Paenibacillus aceris TaxID=869555 RepID=A0ABS4I2H1_9BACL|nr:MBL fold metallo-hydrolase [Paenibacillus aceris]MBP1964359.1 glyoxylase-like metal-dependent hydrolase (beta-lactamase superfamily II) [Paenibacillus aceris]NHW36677.1 MBL fold metallo-hydrolase [Paenibacillus aceris]
MKIAEGIDMLELNLGPMTINPTILYDNESWVLIDTGMPGSAPAIMELAKEAGVGGIPLRSIILTHQDIDHIGGLPAFLAVQDETPVVYAHEDDKDVINGKQPMIKVTPERLTSLLGQLPEVTRNQFEQTFLFPSHPNVECTIADGETLPIAGGLTVIHTPGHTPGHICLYHQRSKTLIAGDAMVAENGELKGPRPAVTPDMSEALRSLKKLSPFDIETVICYHGGRIQGDMNKRIAELAEQS